MATTVTTASITCTGHLGDSPISASIPRSNPMDMSLDDYITQQGILYFRASELLSRAYKGGPMSIPPPRYLWPNIIPTLHAADIIRHTLGAPIRVTSGYRTSVYNDLLGNRPTSQHVSFRALDLVADDLDALASIATQVLDQLHRRGVSTGLGIYPSFVHIDVGASPILNKRRWVG